jgi:hypothetical protein
MTAPAPFTAVKLGPGTLTIGPAGTPIDASCQLLNARITMSKNAGTPKRYLCGSQSAGNITYDYTFTGQMDTDVARGALGLFDYSQVHAGESVEYSYTPNDENGTTASGTLVIDPLDFGADEYGAELDSPFTWSLNGAPTYTYGTGVVADADTAAADQLDDATA